MTKIHWSWTNITIWFSLFIIFSECSDPSVSQISPKSSQYEDRREQFSGTSTVTLESTIAESNMEKSELKHSRIERSALPILNEITAKSSPNDVNKVNLKNADANANAGRYLHYNIKPTTRLNNFVENGEITKSQRMAKDLNNDNSFLLKGGPRLLTSGSPNISPSSVMLTSVTATNQPRQNQNPDIQDIITGIVKLLNGNVNVHANTQVMRRPSASRINNRGPPRISEAQPLPIEYDSQKPLGGSSIRPPPFPFDRPDRPFITGVPIPEQIVPTLQQNYRPGFISQNRPPWQKNRPRQPITGGRRPIPQYKPMPPHHQEDVILLPTTNSETAEIQDVPPTDITYDSDVALDSNEQDQVALGIVDAQPSLNSNEEIPVKKEDHSKKKTNKNKLAEKKNNAVTTDDLTTIIQSTSVVNTAQVVATTQMQSSEQKPNEFIDDSATEDILFITTSSLKSVPVPVLEPSSSHTTMPSMESIPSSISTSPITPTDSSTSNQPIPSPSTQTYQPRPGIVLDDPEFKPGGHGRPQGPRPQRPHLPPQVQPTRANLPPGYGEIFDVTLSAIQGPGSGSGSQQTINIKPYGSYGAGTETDDIIVSPSGDEGFVSIDGKRTYINLFGDPTDAPVSPPAPSTATASHVLNISSHHRPPVITPQPAIGTGYAVAENTVTSIAPSKAAYKPSGGQSTHLPQQRPHYRPRPTQPPVRIDTCIVGDDSTCDQAQNERCKTENGVSSCHCRPGFSRRKHREPCRRIVSFSVGMRVDKIYEHKIVWDKKLLDVNSDPYGQLSYESIRAIDSAMSMTPFSDEFMKANVNNIYKGDPNQGMSGVYVNLTIKLEENAETIRSNLRNDVQKHLLGVIHRRNNNIGNSVLYVDSPTGAISHLQDLDECQSKEFNDCHSQASCTNIWGSFRCECAKGFRDPWSDQPQRAGRDCQSCPDSHCSNRGICSYGDDGIQMCTCDGSFYGSQCEIDGEVLGVAVGASIAAVIIIVLTLVCLIMWSRRWQREQKNAIGSPVFGYLNTATMKGAGMGQPGYQVTLEDRMRWAQIADVMAQTNHYGKSFQAEPVAPTRPSSAMFGYPNLQAMGIGTMGGMNMHGTLPMHHHQNGTLPPIPLPSRLGISSRSNGMRTLENSSSSEEEDRTDLLGRNFQVPRPKSRSNGSIANQSGIYYDVDYEPSGDMYNTTNNMPISTNHQIPGPQGIPMSTYTSGRAPSTYYMK